MLTILFLFSTLSIGSFTPNCKLISVFNFGLIKFSSSRAGQCLNLNVPPSPLPVANPSRTLNYAPASPSMVPHVNFSTLQPIVLAHDYSLQTPSLLNNNKQSSNNNNNNHSNHNNNHSNHNESALPTLTSLDWPTTQKAKRVHSRHH